MFDFTQLDLIRERRPLIHCVSNIVTANDCANLALAVGASPMMAQAPEEMAAISSVSDATVLNTGTPDAEKFRACRICAASARHPVVLDPVGVGASPWRLEQVRALLDRFTPAILRVNLGEAQALLGTDGREQGVDSPLPASQAVRRDTAMELARRRHTAVLLSGPEDLITDGERVWCVTGGSGQMSLVTGTGCMLSVLCGRPGLRLLEGLRPPGGDPGRRTGQRQLPHRPAGRRQHPGGPRRRPGGGDHGSVNAQQPARLNAGRAALSRSAHSRLWVSNISSKERM